MTAIRRFFDRFDLLMTTLMERQRVHMGSYGRHCHSIRHA